MRDKRVTTSSDVRNGGYVSRALATVIVIVMVIVIGESRASFEQAIDVCVSHPDGLQHAGDLISRMKAVGHDLQVTFIVASVVFGVEMTLKRYCDVE